MDVTARIILHEADPESSTDELHRFVFELVDENGARITSISLRTARVLARELAPTTAFMEMVVAIAAADGRTFDELIGRVFTPD
ncbi:hypothetical protein [Caballeronia temeraria]|uniref:hypothetical protein n=1 Tax=Caballeronia temeraria TaxID=1777137 RepID=UPI000772391F|nr:hypothetical protein [Caballeronia temeraria]